MITNKLCNATPFDVSFKYDRGIVLKIPSDGMIDLTMEQMDDFRSGKPGSEEVRQILNYYGLFLLDGDRGYDEQAVVALQASLKEKKAQFDAFVIRTRDQRSATGNPVSDEAMTEMIARAGYDKLEREVIKLGDRVKLLKNMISKEGTSGQTKVSVDPKRTCFVTDPPREFASETALALFISEQPQEFQDQHHKLQKAMIEGANE